MLPVWATPISTLGKDLIGIPLQTSIAEGNKKRLCILSMSNDQKNSNSLSSIRINRYNH